MPLPFSHINPERERGSGKPAHGSNLLQTFLGWERSFLTAAETITQSCTFTGGAENCSARTGLGGVHGLRCLRCAQDRSRRRPVVDFLPASHLSVQSQIALFPAHAGVAADIRPLGVPAPPGAPPCSYLRGPPGGASLQGCSRAQTAAARCGASPAKLHPPPRTSPSKGPLHTPLFRLQSRWNRGTMESCPLVVSVISYWDQSHKSHKRPNSLQRAGIPTRGSKEAETKRTSRGV
ncbi:uncharacterized protein LOC100441727 [Pongo abelii]|uniref:uncharacterized protein LOC100441727 n=1 Tax=Pongo abelii TaxID=9601 RepID=UPI0023E81FFD|nr:uncharacterized protein LOC100441727 [Pongo abelii]